LVFDFLFLSMFASHFEMKQSFLKGLVEFQWRMIFGI
jgi:hypothetical protein